MLPADQQQRKRRKVPDEQAPQKMTQKPLAATLQQFLQAPTEFAPTQEMVHDYIDDEGSTALVQAIKMISADAVEALIGAGADPNKATKKGVTPISAAAHKGNVPIMKILLRGGAQVNLVNPSGSSALIQASHFGHLEAVRVLIGFGAYVDFPNRKGTTALMRASQEGHVEISKLLIQSGANVNRRNNEGMNALMLASQRGHASMVSLLIRNGAAVDAQTTQGSTALMLACKRGHEEVVKVLISMGAEIYMKDCRMRTARDTAIRRHHDGLLRWLDSQVQIRIIRSCLRRRRNNVLLRLRDQYAAGQLDCSHIWAAYNQETKPAPTAPPTEAAPRTLDRMQGVIQPSIPGYTPDQWPLLLTKCLDLPEGVYRNIIEYLPAPRIWAWTLARLKERASLNPQQAVHDSCVIVDEILTDMCVFAGPHQKLHMIRVARSPHTHEALRTSFAMPDELLASLVEWSDIQSLQARLPENELNLKPFTARKMLLVAGHLVHWYTRHTRSRSIRPVDKRRQQPANRKRTARQTSAEEMELNNQSDREDAAHRQTDSSESIMPNSDAEDNVMSNRTLESYFEEALDISQPVPMMLTSTAVARIPDGTNRNMAIAPVFEGEGEDDDEEDESVAQVGGSDADEVEVRVDLDDEVDIEAGVDDVLALAQL